MATKPTTIEASLYTDLWIVTCPYLKSHGVSASLPGALRDLAWTIEGHYEAFRKDRDLAPDAKQWLKDLKMAMGVKPATRSSHGKRSRRKSCTG